MSKAENNEDLFLDAVFNSKITGLDSEEAEFIKANAAVLYEYNFSGGQYWVQKMSGANRPVLFFYTLAEYENELYLLVSYSMHSVKGEQTHDRIIVYEYADLDPKQLESLLAVAL